MKLFTCRYLVDCLKDDLQIKMQSKCNHSHPSVLIFCFWIAVSLPFCTFPSPNFYFIFIFLGKSDTVKGTVSYNKEDETVTFTFPSEIQVSLYCTVDSLFSLVPIFLGSRKIGFWGFTKFCMHAY